MERLDKFISSMTEYTRSQIKKLALDGKIQVNSEIVKDCSLKINPETDRIYVCKREITFKEKVYILMNKPYGVVCATADRRDKTVLDLLSDDVKRKDLFPAGRLDKDTRGMVLITNDGELSHRILSPKKHIPKYYLVRLKENFCEKYAKEFEQGIIIDGGEKCLPAKVRGLENCPDAAFLELFEGKFHQVKRMFAAVENHVESLVRIRMGNLSMPENLESGSYVELLHKDVEKLLKTQSFEEVYNEFDSIFSSYWINKL